MLWSVLVVLVLPGLSSARSAAQQAQHQTPPQQQQPQQQDVEWRSIHKQTDAADGGGAQPGIRYGHTCAAYQGQLVTTHGYFYDRDKTQAVWLSDTWTMSMQPPYRWRQLDPGISQAAALSAYSHDSIPPAPCGRFGHTSAMLNHTLYMYGGQDGGYSRHGKQNYEPGYDFSELWALDFKVGRWAYMAPSGEDSPGRRHLAAMAGVQNQLLVYGGMADGQGDVWAFNLTSRQWRLLAADPQSLHAPRSSSSSPAAPQAPHPGRRMGHTLTPITFPDSGTYGMLLYGGRVLDADGHTSLPADVWFFDLTTAKWRQVGVAPGSPQPPPRIYHAAAHTYVPVPGSGDRQVVTTAAARSHAAGAAQPGQHTQHDQMAMPRGAAFVGFVLAGTTTSPKLSCAADSWAFVLDCGATTIRWQQLPDLPAAVYDSRAAADSHALYMLGGHLCAHTPGYPFFYSNEVVRLSFPSLLRDSLLPHSCVVDAAQLLQEAPHAHGGRHEEL